MFSSLLGLGFLAVAIAFMFKIGWNIAVPYLMAWELLRSNRTEHQGVSLMPAVEILLLATLVLIRSIAGDGDTCPASPLSILGSGAILILASYLHFLVAGMFCGWLVSKMGHKSVM